MYTPVYDPCRRPKDGPCRCVAEIAECELIYLGEGRSVVACAAIGRLTSVERKLCSQNARVPSLGLQKPPRFLLLADFDGPVCAPLWDHQNIRRTRAVADTVCDGSESFGGGDPDCRLVRVWSGSSIAFKTVRSPWES
jgi:hypothetical protein